ncbi:MAG: hypothetical protein ACRD12_12660 [Acidimicrobiales bacterium]
MTLTEIIESWVRDAERMGNAPARGVVVTEQLFDQPVAEQGCAGPAVAGLDALVARDLLVRPEMVEIPGPDRVCVYIGVAPDESAAPLGLDPAMPVFFVPLPPHVLAEPAHLEMYNRLRWYGLGPGEAWAGSA